MIDGFSAVNAILSCATIGLFTAVFITVLAWIGLFPALFIDTVESKEDDEGL